MALIRLLLLQTQHCLLLILRCYAQSTGTLSADIEIDTSAPSNPVVIIEVLAILLILLKQQPLDVSVVSAGDAEVSSISGTVLH